MPDPLQMAFIQAFLRRVETLGFTCERSSRPGALWDIFMEEKRVCVLLESTGLERLVLPTGPDDPVKPLFDLRENLLAPYRTYRKARDLAVCEVPGYRIFSEFDGVVLAGLVRPDGEMKFTTWQYRFDRTGVRDGVDYGNNYERAKKGFALRSGLVRESKVLDHEMVEVLRSACAYCLEHESDMGVDKARQIVAMYGWLGESRQSREQRQHSRSVEHEH